MNDGLIITSCLIYSLVKLSEEAVSVHGQELLATPVPVCLPFRSTQNIEILGEYPVGMISLQCASTPQYTMATGRSWNRPPLTALL